MKRKTRLFSLLLAVAVLFVVLVSPFLLAETANHSCAGKDCPVCYQIGVCEHALKTLGTAVFAALAALLLCAFSFSLPVCVRRAAVTPSPITLKVKLTN